MASHVNHPEGARPTRKTLYLVAGLCVAIGFIVAAVSAVQGDRLGAFLGFLMMSGALAGGALIRAAVGIGLRVVAIEDTLDELRVQLNRLETLVGSLAERGHDAAISGGVRIVDLAAVGSGDPAVLTAATLDRTDFPRLVTTMDEEPPAQAAEPAGGDAPHPISCTIPSDGTTAMDDVGQMDSALAWPAVRNLLRQWKIALRDGDLATCRTVLSTLVDTAGSAALTPLQAQIKDLADRTERSLRTQFAAQVRAGNFAAALTIGERLCVLLPDRPVVEEFNRLRPHLERRLAATRLSLAQ